MNPARILCVDDEPQILSGLRRVLRGKFDISIAMRPEDGLEMLQSSGPYAVVVSDMAMPGMDGVQFLARSRAIAPQTVRIMFTGNGDQATAAKAVNQGAVFRFLNKPCPPEEFAAALESGIEQYRHACAERELLEQTLEGSVRVLAEILALTDPATFGRSIRLREGASFVARVLGAAERWEIEIAAMLLELGSITVPAEMRHRIASGEKLSEEDRSVLACVPEVGAKLLRQIPRMEGVAAIVSSTRDAQPCEASPLGARILRPLRELLILEEGGHSLPDAWALLLSASPHYDARVLGAMQPWVEEHARRASAGTECILQLPFAELRPGHVLAGPIATANGMLLLPKGQTISVLAMERMRNHVRVAGVREPVPVYGNAHPSTPRRCGIPSAVGEDSSTPRGHSS